MKERAFLAMFLAWAGCQPGPPEPGTPAPQGTPSNSMPGMQPSPPATPGQCQTGWCWENPLPAGNPLQAVWGRAKDDVWAVGAVGTIVHWDGRAWSFVPSGTQHDLRAVWAAAADDAWAVGSEGTIVHWNGSRWSPVFPTGTAEDLCHIGGIGDNEVRAFACDFYLESDTWKLTALLWDGSRWSPIAPIEIVNPIDNNSPPGISSWPGSRELWMAVYIPGDEGDRGELWLLDEKGWKTIAQKGGGFQNWGSYSVVWSPAPGQAWASYSEHTTDPMDLNPPKTWTGIEFWDGQQLQHISDGHARAVGGTGPADVWLADNEQTYHFDGTILKSVLPVLPVTPFFAAAPGVFFSTQGSYLWRWDGAGQKQLAFPSGLSDELHSLWRGPAGDAWAVGDDGVVLHRVRGQWQIQARLTGNALLSIWGTAGKLWAAGPENEAFMWDGKTWSLFEIPYEYSIEAISGTAADDIWVAGDGEMLHYNGHSWDHMAGAAWGRYSISAPQRDDAWFTCQQAERPDDGAPLGFLAHWDGAKWDNSLPPMLGHDERTQAIWASGPTDAWLRSDAGKFYHFDGKTWTVLPAGEAGANACAMWGRSARDLFTVCDLPGRGSQVLHWDGTIWSEQPAALGQVVGLSGGDDELLALGKGAVILRQVLK